METADAIQPLTFRVENIPRGTTAEDLKKYFNKDDQPHLQVRSLVPAIDSHSFDDGYTATVTFRSPNEAVHLPRTLDDSISIDDEFYGFTPLNHPQEPIVAE